MRLPVHISFHFLVFLTGNLSAQVNENFTSKQKLTVPEPQIFQHKEDCQVFQYTPDRNNNDTVLIGSYAYENGKPICKLMGDFEGESEYYIERSHLGGKYLEKYFYNEKGLLIKEEVYHPESKNCDWTFYYYNENDLLIAKETWRYGRNLKPGVKTSDGCLVRELHDADFEKEYTWDLIAKDEFTYNDERLLIEKNHFLGATNIAYETYTYTYDSLNRLKAETHKIYYGDSDYREWKYFSWGYEIHLPGNVTTEKSKYVYETNDKGLIIKEWYESENGYMSGVKNYTYDERGRLIMDITSSNYNGEQLESVHWYKYRD